MQAEAGHGRLKKARSYFLRGASFAFLIQLGGTVVTFASQFCFARWMGLGEYGLYTYVVSWISLLAALATLGFPSSAMRFLPQYMELKEARFANGFLRFSQRLDVGAAVVLASCFAVVVNIVSHDHISIAVVLLAALSIPFASLLTLQSELYRSVGSIVIAYLPSRIGRQTLVLIAATGVLFTKHSLDAAEVVLITTVTYSIIWLLQRAFRGKVFPYKWISAKPMYDAKAWAGVSAAMFAITSFQLLVSQSDVLILGALHGSEQAGIYNIAVKLASLVTFILSASQSIAAPTFSRLYHSGNYVDLRRMILLTNWWTFIPTVLVAAVLLISAPFVLKFFGQAFLDALVPMVILVFGQIINTGCGAVGFLLNISGNHRVSMRIFAVVALVSITCNFLFIPRYGAVGAACVTAGTTGLWNIWLAVAVKRRIGINATVLALKKG